MNVLKEKPPGSSGDEHEALSFMQVMNRNPNLTKLGILLHL